MLQSPFSTWNGSRRANCLHRFCIKIAGIILISLTSQNGVYTKCHKSVLQCEQPDIASSLGSHYLEFRRIMKSPFIGQNRQKHFSPYRYAPHTVPNVIFVAFASHLSITKVRIAVLSAFKNYFGSIAARYISNVSKICQLSPLLRFHSIWKCIACRAEQQYLSPPRIAE